MSTDLKNIDSVTKFLKKYRVITISILLIGLFLRFYKFSYQSYWLDELFSAELSNPENSLSFVISSTLNDVHPPLYQLGLWISYNIFGYTESLGRLFSGVVGTLGLFGFYLLGKELFHKLTAQVSTFLAAINYFLIYYAQEVRSYSLVFCLTIFSYLYLIRLLHKRNKWNLIGYILITISLLYTHYFGLFLVATQIFVILLYYFKFSQEKKITLQSALISGGILCLLTLPLVPAILSNTQKESWWAETPKVSFLLDYFPIYFLSSSLAILAGILILPALFQIYRTKDQQEKFSLLALVIWISVGYLLPYLRSITATPILIPRNTIIVLPAILLLVSYGITFFKNKLAIAGILSVFSFLSVTPLTWYYTEVHKQQWREILIEADQHNANVPAYFIVPGAKYYQSYDNLLDIPLEVSSWSQYVDNTSPENLASCFWILDFFDDTTGGYHNAEIEKLEQFSFKPVKIIQKYKTVGILFARENAINTNSCQ